MGWVERKVKEIMNEHRTNDPFQIAAEKGISVFYADLGETLGFFTSYKGVKMINLHTDLDDTMKKFVCAHELGHALLHDGINTLFLHKHTFMSIDKIEVEAYKFATYLLLGDVDISKYRTRFRVCTDNGIPCEMERFI